MFQVVLRNSKNRSPITVYSVRKRAELIERFEPSGKNYYGDESGTEFLVYSNGWEWVDASHYTPYEEK